MPLTNHPNNIAVTKNGDRVAGRHRARPRRGRRHRRQDPDPHQEHPGEGRLHNIYVTPDGKHLITGSIPQKLMTVIDLADESPVWALEFDRASGR